MIVMKVKHLTIDLVFHSSIGHVPLDRTVSNLNIYAQVPQHMSAGLVQIFGTLASFEFAYFIAPRSARSLFISLAIIGRVLGGSIAFVYLSLLLNRATGTDFSVSIKTL